MDMQPNRTSRREGRDSVRSGGSRRAPIHRAARAGAHSPRFTGSLSVVAFLGTLLLSPAALAASSVERLQGFSLDQVQVAHDLAVPRGQPMPISVQRFAGAIQENTCSHSCGIWGWLDHSESNSIHSSPHTNALPAPSWTAYATVT
jgi:hypothetical protein